MVKAGGRPVAGARVEIAPLDVHGLPVAGRKGTYREAQRQFAAGVRLPRTISDATGRCRLLLSPAQRMLDGSTSQEFELRVEAPGFATWRCALGNRVVPDVTGVELVAQRADAGLVLECKDAAGPLSGFVVIERPFRTRSGRTLWLSDLVPIGADGLVLYPEPPRVPGERLAIEPSVRVEGYRVTLWALARPRKVWSFGVGRHRLDPGPDDGSWRRIVAERGEAPPGPIRASWIVADQLQEVTLPGPRVPLLAGMIPQRIDTGGGRVLIDTWDPDLPMFVERAQGRAAAGAADGQDAAGDPTAPEEGATGATTEIRVVDRRDRPVAGAIVWLEDSAMRQVEREVAAFATADRDGVARFTGIPRGVHRVLALDPVHGEREVPIAFGGDASPPVRLVRRAHGGADPQGLPGTMLLDLTGAPGGPDDPIEVGVLLPDRRVVARRFAERPQHVRLEGLVLGPTTFYVRAGKAPPTIMAGVLNGGLDAPAVRPFETAVRKLRILVMEPDGTPAEGVALSLNDGGDAKRPPPSASLFALTAAGEGTYEFDLALHGTLWVRVHGKDEGFADLAIPLPEQEIGLGVRLKR